MKFKFLSRALAWAAALVAASAVTLSLATFVLSVGENNVIDDFALSGRPMVVPGAGPVSMVVTCPGASPEDMGAMAAGEGGTPPVNDF